MVQNKKIVVCQFYTSNVSYGKYTEEINKKYCNNNNYIYFVETNGEKIKDKLQGRSWTWYKPHLINEVFNNHPDCDYVLFLDIDAIFCNEQRKIEEFITDDFSILMTEDYGPSIVNAGVMLLKNDNFSKDFIKNWWDICELHPQYKTGLWHDQTCIGLLYPTLQDKQKFKIITNNDLNARSYNDDRFIFHAFSFGSIPNRTIDSIYYKKFNISINSKDLTELSNFYGPDKGFAHNYYERFYKKLLEPKQAACDVLEICNTSNLASLFVWRDYFDEGLVHGIIPNKDKEGDGRIETFIVNNSNENEIKQFSDLKFQYDVIVDDGTHKMKDQQTNIQLLFNNLKPGGYYVIADLQTSIECKTSGKEVFGWGDPQKTTTLEMLQSFINKTPKTDYVTNLWEYFYNNVEYVEISQDRNDSIYGIIKKVDIEANITSRIETNVEYKTEPEINDKLEPSPVNQPEIEVGSTILNDIKKINVVYHCYLVGNWKQLILEQFDRLKNSGLYDSANKIIVTVNLDDKSEDDIKKLLIDFTKLEFRFSQQNTAEYLGIKTVREIALSENCYVLYFHSKGVSNFYDNLLDKNFSNEKVKNISSWRKCLEYFLIDRWEECINLLVDYDNVGVTCNRNWFWGNFWWTKTEHVLKTVPVDLWGRWEYEAWLNKNIHDAKNYEWYHFDFNPYLTYMDEDWYRATQHNSSRDKIILHKAFYGTPNFQIDEGYSVTNLNLGEDVTIFVEKLLAEHNYEKFDFLVDNGYLGGDPLPQTKKFLIIDFSLESNPTKIYQVGIDENQKLNLEFKINSSNYISNQITQNNENTIATQVTTLTSNFDKNKNIKILILVIGCKTYNHKEQVIIDRTDLTRRLDCKNTWVEDAFNSGIDVVFFEGDSEIESYNPDNITLSLDVDDRYEDYSVNSRIFAKIQKAFKWVLNNKDFDMLYLADDDIFINIPQFLKEDLNFDFIVNDVLGGSGFFWSKKAIEHCLKYDNEGFSQADLGIFSIMMRDESLKRKTDLNTCCPQYFPGELYSTVHYVTGKRTYHFHNILKNYRENGITNRKIILFFPLNSMVDNRIVTYETTANKKTKRWYDFTEDINGWEYHGGYTRSAMDMPYLKRFWPYAEKATKYFVINYDHVVNDLDFLVSKCENSLINSQNVFLISEKNSFIDGWVIDQTLKETLKLNFETLNNCFLYKKI